MKKIFIIVVVVLCAMVLFKDSIIKQVIVTAASGVMGTKMEIDSFSTSFTKQKVRIEGFRVYNPKNFPEGILLDIKSVGVEFDLGMVFQGKIHMPYVEFDLNELNIVKNKDGDVNITSLKISQEKKKDESQKKEKPSEDKKKSDLKFQIDLVSLNINKIVHTDHSVGVVPVVKVYDVNLKNKEYRNITSPEQLIALILTSSMRGLAIKGVAMVGLSALSGVGLPVVGVANVLLGEDAATDSFPVSFDKVLDVVHQILSSGGGLEESDQSIGFFKGKVDGHHVTVKLDQSGNEVAVTVTARKLFIPKPGFARGLLHKISGQIK